MSLTLSGTDLARLERSLRTLLSPLDHPNVDDWRASVARTLAEFLAAERGIFELRAPGVFPFYMRGYDSNAARSYADYYSGLDLGRIRRNSHKLAVWSRALMFRKDLPTLYRSECYNDFLMPHGMGDSMGITVWQGGGDPPGLYFHRTRFGTEEFGERGLALLRLLHPAFTAGAKMYFALAESREGLGRMLDALGEAIAVFDGRAKLLHMNHALAKLLDADPERERLRGNVWRIACALAGLARGGTKTGTTPVELPVLRQIRTARARYRLRGSYAGGGLLGGRRAILVSVDRLTPALPSEAALRERFGLTKKQVQVAILLVQGQSNREIAQTLSISPHTARHHTEKIFLKLDVHTRKAAAQRIDEVGQDGSGLIG